ncbi:DEAD/DEAH box helicase [Bosea vaviloviae]|uniref:DEAD/DEAH box helicase n=1 Tax=Bosea vaviloviae TaxID=1526658 RepID=UPI0006BB3E52|nr:DEAD/DEAH box helicase [Bosea vaviloviae]
MTAPFTFSFDQSGGELRLAEEKRGLFGFLRRRGTRDLLALPKEDRALGMAVARLHALDRDGREHDVTATSLRLSHRLLAQLDSATARALGLPPLLTGYVFKAALRGSLGSPNFRIDWWWARGEKTIPLRRVGAVVETVDGPARLPPPILQAIEVAESFDPKSPIADHWLTVGRFRTALGTDNDPAVAFDQEGLLGEIEVVTCECVGLQLFDADDARFEALPLARSSGGDLALPDASNALIHGAELAEFQRQTKARSAQPAYRIGPKRFLILDRSAMPVVQVIAEAAKQPDGGRRRFIIEAEQVITDAIERQALADGRLNELMSPEGYAEALEREVGRSWAETREWASRVIAVAEWTRPVLGQLSGSGTQWLPPSLAPELGEILGAVPDDEVENLLRELRHAIEHGQSVIQHSAGEIPVIPDVVEALMRRLEMIGRRQQIAPPGDPTTVFLPVTHSNFWDNDFSAQLRRRETLQGAMPADLLRTKLKPHQDRSFQWQVSAWSAGLPGILNADEQGLGKTLQTLAFLAWLADHMARGKVACRPILIVAPTSLLRNWEAELDLHFVSGVWGEPVRLYGQHLQKWKVPAVRGRDIDDGVAKLDLSELTASKRPQLVITTYQTLANYAVTFSVTDFSVAIFDEIQNLKNPAAMRSEAAKAVKADFKIGLTGTPVENATRDIWAIIDQLFPGALGPLQEFRRIFDTPTELRMRQLHAAIFASQAGRPAIGLRRLKKDAASDLPPKVRVLHPRIMPETQALRYDEARAKGGGMFALLHHIRRTSLHPGLIEGETPDRFALSSARTTAALDILGAIQKKKERALVFIENRDVQAWFAELVKIEFGLEQVYVINGDTGIDARKEITDRFQRHLKDDQGFDILVLGPRAAGTGLTLTAANHVIHLTRWWNPAVEEQCNDRTHRIGQTRPVTVHIPLAVHPRLGPKSFDCLLQRLMRRKRNLAESVLWPQESGDAELASLYNSILEKEEVTSEKPEEMRLFDRPDLIVTCHWFVIQRRLEPQPVLRRVAWG